MKKRTSHSRAFFLEIIVNLLLFSICAAICLQLFVLGYLRSMDSRVLTEASMKAQSFAEIFKHEQGREPSIAQRTGGIYSGGKILIYYDKNWNLSAESEAHYRLSCDILGGAGLKKAEIRAFNGENEIFSLTAMVAV